MMMMEHDGEPMRGLPGVPPAGERILWQGAPNWRRLATSAFHVRTVAAYFGILALVAAVGFRSLTGVVMMGSFATVVLGMLALLAWATARTTVYTLTDRRLVLRIGIALPACINLPLKLIGAVDLDARRGDLALTLTGADQPSYVALWPHAQPWRLSPARPMLRSLGNADEVGALIARACAAGAAPIGAVPLPVTPPKLVPDAVAA